MITWVHGLFGAPTDFAAVSELLEVPGNQAAMALPGHGGSPPLDYYERPGFDEVTSSLIVALDQAGVETTALVGYSMGARVAMHVALAYPERITHLVVIGGHTGLDGEQARAGRLLLDRKRASLIRGGGLRPFLQTWYRQPMFAHFRASPQFNAIFEARCDGDAEAVAITLERLSPGLQEPLADAMAACPVPTLWVAGEYDMRYVELLSEVAERQASGRFVQIPHAGHVVPAEAPEALAQALNTFLKS